MLLLRSCVHVIIIALYNHCDERVGCQCKFVMFIVAWLKTWCVRPVRYSAHG